jgi:hypothetical protein
MSLIPCMGGWCTKRGHCAHYHAASPQQIPEERLCLPGQDGVRDGYPVQIHKPAGTWESPRFEGLARADVFPLELLG